MRIFLLVYVTLMVSFSTVYIITMIIALTSRIFGSPNNLLSPSSLFQNGLAGAMCVTFASWGADGFMVRNFQKVKEKGILTISLYSSGDA